MRGRYAHSLLNLAISITQACRCGHGPPRAHRPLRACLLVGHGGIHLPRAHRLSSITRIHAHQVLQLLLHQIYSTWPRCPISSMRRDSTGAHAHHNSSTRHDNLDAINYLRKVSADGMCPEATPFAGMEAPQWSQGLRRLPRRSNSTFRSTGTRVAYPPKNQPTPQSWVGSH